jgi:hypothetical protein
MDLGCVTPVPAFLSVEALRGRTGVLQARRERTTSSVSMIQFAIASEQLLDTHLGARGLSCNVFSHPVPHQVSFFMLAATQKIFREFNKAL